MGIFSSPPREEKPSWIGAWKYDLERTDTSNYIVPEFRYSLRALSPSDNISALSNLPVDSPPRTLELWRDKSGTKTVVTGHDASILEPYKMAYPDLRVEKMTETEPSWFKNITDKNVPVVFDVSLNHSLPFGTYRISGNLINSIAAALPENAWIQIVYARYDWGGFAEETAHAINSYVQTIKQGVRRAIPGVGVNFVPYPPEMVSPLVVRLGPDMVADFIERAHVSAGVAVHIRGMVLGADANAISALASVFTANIHTEYDTPVVIDETDPATKDWFLKRLMPDPTPLLVELSTHTFSRAGVAPWGQGRELIPTFLIDQSEIPGFVALPMPSAVRKPPAKKKGFVLGDEI